MSEQQPPRLRLYLTALVTLTELARLAWEHLSGGVASHHVLNRSDTPAPTDGATPAAGTDSV